MKIEEVSDNKNRFDKVKKYWFPLSKGYNRILIVIGVVILAYFTIKNIRYDDVWILALITIFIEAAIYLAAIWIYRGFKDLNEN